MRTPREVVENFMYCSVEGFEIEAIEYNNVKHQYDVVFTEKGEWFATIPVYRHEIQDKYHVPLQVEITQIACQRFKEMLCPS